MNLKLISVIFATFIASISTANAAVYTFDVTFDGTTVSLDSGSDSPGNLELFVGDSFTLNIRAEENYLWRTIQDQDEFFVFASFVTEEPAVRTANIVTNVYLDNSVVATQTDFDVLQSQIHVGGQNFDFDLGLDFDHVQIIWDFIATDNTTTILELGNILGFDPFYNFTNTFDYTLDNVEAVSAPATLLMLISGLLFLRLKK